MEIFALTLMVSFLATFGGKDQRLVADLVLKLGRSPGFVLVSALTSGLTGVGMACLGAALSGQLLGAERAYLIAAALAASAVWLFLPHANKMPKEPTRSLGAIAIVLILRQIVDAPRLAIFAGGAAIASAYPAAWGGAIGATAALWLAIGWPGPMAPPNAWRYGRLSLAIILALTGLFIVYIAQGPLA